MILLRAFGALFLLLMAWLVASIVQAVRPLRHPDAGESKYGRLSEDELENLVRRHRA